jgi:hypothetical protein
MSIEDYLSHFTMGNVLDIQLNTELGGTVVAACSEHSGLGEPKQELNFGVRHS